jgi:DNA-binding CsgD family transcriptional regulator
LRTLGLISGDLELLRQSAAVAATSGAELENAQSLYELGAATRRDGRRSEAREPLYAALEKAYRCGATVLAARAREELVATGARPRGAVRTGVDALTPSELRVSRMAAAGMTNPEIAQELFVTIRTVQVHLTNSYRKLDIASRKELRAALEGSGPPPARSTGGSLHRR